MFRSLVIYIFAIGLLSTVNGYGCPPDGQLPSHCNCYDHGESYIPVTCHYGYEDETKVVKQRDDYDAYTVIYCTTENGFGDKTVDEIIPRLEIGVQEYVKIDMDCPFNKSTIKDYLDRVGLTGVERLRFNGPEEPPTLTKEMFAGASSIVNWDLDGNRIEYLRPDVFEYLTGLTKIKLSRNRIDWLPEILFSNNKMVKEMILYGNKIKFIPPDLFINNVELEILNLSQNKIDKLPASLFESNKKLRKIDLSHNEIKTIPDNLLTSLEQLEDLNLSVNKIQHLSGALLPSHITTLKLYKNQLEVIDASFLQRFQAGLYNDFDFTDNPIKCQCDDDFLRLEDVSAKISEFDEYRCGNMPRLIRDVIGECKNGTQSSVLLVISAKD